MYHVSPLICAVPTTSYSIAMNLHKHSPDLFKIVRDNDVMILVLTYLFFACTTVHFFIIQQRRLLPSFFT